MCRQIFLAGLAAAVLFSGCKLQKEEPVAKEKSAGRLLDAVFKKFVKTGGRNSEKIVSLVKRSLSFGLEGPEIKLLVKALVTGGESGIRRFKMAGIADDIEAFRATKKEIGDRIQSKLRSMSDEAAQEYHDISLKHDSHIRREYADLDFDDSSSLVEQAMANVLMKNSDIADDKIFERLVKQQNSQLVDITEAIVGNHVLADAISADFVKEVSKTVGRTLNDSEVAEITSALKVNASDIVDSVDSDYFLMVIQPPKKYKEIGSGYTELEKITGVAMLDKVAALDTLLEGGKLGWRTSDVLTNDEIKHLGAPLSRNVFSGGVNNPYWDNSSSSVMRKLYGSN